MRGNELLAWLARLPSGARDAAVEQHLGIAAEGVDSRPPGPELIGYHASGVSAIVQALTLVPVQPDDVLIDLGAGLGKVAILAQLLTGARARGVELQAALVARAQAASRRLGTSVEFEHGDARAADLNSGTVFYLYAPFGARVLGEVLTVVESVATVRAIVVCALGVDLPPNATWLVPRATDSFLAYGV